MFSNPKAIAGQTTEQLTQLVFQTLSPIYKSKITASRDKYVALMAEESAAVPHSSTVKRKIKLPSDRRARANSADKKKSERNRDAVKINKSKPINDLATSMTGRFTITLLPKIKAIYFLDRNEICPKIARIMWSYVADVDRQMKTLVQNQGIPVKYLFKETITISNVSFKAVFLKRFNPQRDPDYQITRMENRFMLDMTLAESKAFLDQVTAAKKLIDSFVDDARLEAAKEGYPDEPPDLQLSIEWMNKSFKEAIEYVSSRMDDPEELQDELGYLDENNDDDHESTTRLQRFIFAGNTITQESRRLLASFKEELDDIMMTVAYELQQKREG